MANAKPVNPAEKCEDPNVPEEPTKKKTGEDLKVGDVVQSTDGSKMKVTKVLENGGFIGLAVK